MFDFKTVSFIILSYNHFEMDYEKHIEEIQKISHFINAKLKAGANNYDEWHENVMSKMNLIIQCEQAFEEKDSNIQIDAVKLRSMNEQLEKELDENSKKLAEIKNEYKNVADEYKAFKKEYDNQTQLCKETREQINLSQKDKDILNIERTKYELYKKITNTVWDYTVPHTVMVSGYVRNRSKGYIHPFEFKRNEMAHSELVENMWKEVDLGTGEDWSDIIEMTNKQDKENLP